MRTYEIGKKLIHPTWSRRPINPHWTQSRAGVIPYKLVDGELYFLFGYHTTEKQFVDFSSFVKTVDRSPEGTLIRAVKDKSLGLINVTEEILDLPTTLYLHDPYSLVVFIQINKPNIIEHFNIINSDGRQVKYERLEWISSHDLVNIITKETPIIRRQVRCLIRDISKIIPILKYNK
jgi:hypothetical protein